jgi:hypothetical protein
MDPAALHRVPRKIMDLRALLQRYPGIEGGDAFEMGSD